MSHESQVAMDGSPAVVEIRNSRKGQITNPEAPQAVPQDAVAPAAPDASITFQLGPIQEVVRWGERVFHRRCERHE